MNAATLRVQIVDDEPLAADRLSRLCARLEGLEVVGLAADGAAALSGLDELRPDMVLLDISMPGMDGMALARALSSRDDPPAVVFVTAHSCYAIEAFEVAAIDYLLKPVSLSRLGQAVTRVRARRPQPTPASEHLAEIWAPRGREMVRLGVETLDLLEAERDYVRLHARGQAFLIRATLQTLEQRLDPQQFVRVHRSTIIPTCRISGLGRGVSGGMTVTLSSGKQVRVGRSFQPSLRKLVKDLDQS